MVIHTPQGVFSSKKMNHHNEKQTGSRLIRKGHLHISSIPIQNAEAPSVSRCLAYRRIETEVFHSGTLLFLLWKHSLLLCSFSTIYHIIQNSPCHKYNSFFLFSCDKRILERLHMEYLCNNRHFFSLENNVPLIKGLTIPQQK